MDRAGHYPESIGSSESVKEGVQLGRPDVPGHLGVECAAFILGWSAPDSGVLAGLDSPFHAGVNHLASTAYGLCFLDLEKRGASVPNGEEQFRVLAEAGSTITPRHQDRAP